MRICYFLSIPTVSHNFVDFFQLALRKQLGFWRRFFNQNTQTEDIFISSSRSHPLLPHSREGFWSNRLPRNLAMISHIHLKIECPKPNSSFHLLPPLPTLPCLFFFLHSRSYPNSVNHQGWQLLHTNLHLYYHWPSSAVHFISLLLL